MNIFPDDPSTGQIGRKQQFDTIDVLPNSSRVLLGNREGGGGLGGVFCFSSDIDQEATSGVEVWLDGAGTGDDFLRLSARNVTVLAVDQSEEFLYVGTKGLSFYNTSSKGWGTVLRATIPEKGQVPANWEVLINGDSSPSIGYSVPFFNHAGFGSDQEEMNRRLTNIYDIEIDPFNPMQIYVGLGMGRTLHPKNGVYKLDFNGNLTQIIGDNGDGGPQTSATVVTIIPGEPESLLVGTGGQEFFSTGITPSPIPVIHNQAIYTIPPTSDDNQVMAFSGTALNGTPLAIAYVDASLLGGSSHLELNDSGQNGDLLAGDAIWSAEIEVTVPDGVGVYELPVVVRDPDWNTFTGTVQVQVADAPNIEFTDVSGDTGHLESVPKATSIPYASSVFDFDLDEELDMFVSYSGEKGHLFRNSQILPNGIPVFTDIGFDGFDPSTPDVANQRGISYAALKDSVPPAIFVARPDSSQFFVMNEVSGLYENLVTTMIPDLSGPCRDSDWVDYDNDGDYDLAVAMSEVSQDGSIGAQKQMGVASRLYRQNDSGTFDWVYDDDIFPQTSLDDQHCSFEIVWYDVNDDDWPDLFICDLMPSNSSSLFINQGLNENDEAWFINETNNWFPSNAMPKGVRSAIFEDFDKDGHVDLVTCSWAQDDNLTFYSNNGTSFSVADKSAKFIPHEPRWKNGLACSDFDGNGFMDILVQPHYENDEPYILFNGLGGQEGVFSRFKGIGLDVGMAQGGSIANWDNLGGPDVFLGRAPGGGDFFYQNTTPQGAISAPSIRVKFHGGGGENIDGLGAKVEILDAAFQDSKVLWGKNGRLSTPHELQFNLPGCQLQALVVRVTWPSGHTQYQVCSINAVTTVEDDSYLIDDSTVTSEYQPGPFGNDWIFEWVTIGPSLVSEDYVTVFGPTDINSPCYCSGVITLDDSANDVDVTIIKVATGWKHTLTWHNGCCIVRQPDCIFPYEVGSGHSFASDISANHVFKKMKVCGAVLPIIPQ